MTPQDLADLAEALVAPAARLVGAVHDDGPADVARALSAVRAEHLPGLAVVLAAMVDPDRSPSDLLAWVTWDDVPPNRQGSLFSGWNVPLPPRKILPRAARFDEVDVTDLDPGDVANWPDDVCQALRREHRRRFVDPERAPYARLGHLEWDRRRNRAARAKGATPDDSGPVSSKVNG